jgi:CheY-like chemotaxis protein
MIGGYLKQADKFLLQHDFDAAEAEVEKALQLEGTNLYALAYKERIQTLRKEFQEKWQREEEQRRLQEEANKTAAAMKPSPPPSPPPKIVSETTSPIILPPQQAESAPLPEKPPPSRTADDQYRKILHEAWRDGVLNDEEKTTLEKERKRLGIDPVVREKLEHDVQVQCYVDAVRASIYEWAISPIKPNALEGLRKKFGITTEEHLAIEGRILWELQHKPHSATILLVDDEEDYLIVIGEGLREHGYKVFTAATPEEALTMLKTLRPDIILCDIRFDNSGLDGFAVYKRIRANPELAVVPFLFVTGIKDEWVVQQGLEIGADEYITKPFTISILLATIEGKLLRYEELKRALQ